MNWEWGRCVCVWFGDSIRTTVYLVRPRSFFFRQWHLLQHTRQRTEDTRHRDLQASTTSMRLLTFLGGQFELAVLHIYNTYEPTNIHAYTQKQGSARDGT